MEMTDQEMKQRIDELEMVACTLQYQVDKLTEENMDLSSTSQVIDIFMMLISFVIVSVVLYFGFRS